MINFRAWVTFDYLLNKIGSKRKKLNQPAVSFSSSSRVPTVPSPFAIVQLTQSPALWPYGAPEPLSHSGPQPFRSWKTCPERPWPHCRRRLTWTRNAESTIYETPESSRFHLNNLEHVLHNRFYLFGTSTLYTVYL